MASIPARISRYRPWPRRSFSSTSRFRITGRTLRRDERFSARTSPRRLKKYGESPRADKQFAASNFGEAIANLRRRDGLSRNAHPTTDSQGRLWRRRRRRSRRSRSRGLRWRLRCRTRCRCRSSMTVLVWAACLFSVSASSRTGNPRPSSPSPAGRRSCERRLSHLAFELSLFRHFSVTSPAPLQQVLAHMGPGAGRGRGDR